MNELTLLGLIMLIIGVVLAPFTVFFTLILALVGILVMISGRGHISPKYGLYPMYRICAGCQSVVYANAEVCPECKGSTASQTQASTRAPAQPQPSEQAQTPPRK
jgi:hypothetical protein